MKISKVKVARISKGLTQTELAQKVGIGLNTMVAIEKGKFQQVGLMKLVRISEVLEVSFTELFL